MGDLGQVSQVWMEGMVPLMEDVTPFEKWVVEQMDRTEAEMWSHDPMTEEFRRAGQRWRGLAEWLRAVNPYHRYLGEGE